MGDRLRIALVAPIADRVAPDSGSSIEQLVSLLAEDFARRGHRVTLFATGDSQTTATLHALYPRGYRRDHELWDNWEFHEAMNASAAFARSSEFDVIHSHSYHYALPFARLVDVPTMHTYHIPPSRDVLRCYARVPEAQLVAVSRYHRRKFVGIDSIPVIYNGIATARFPFNAARGDYLLFVGHLIERKGPIQAIQVARKAGMRLVMAGKGGEYFRAEVAPLIDGTFIEYVGPVNVDERNRLMAGAAALLFPSVHAEPFGLVLIEAMACGTPVAALNRCAVPEIVEPGVTGYYADDVDSLAALIHDTTALDRARVRQEAVRRFDFVGMASEYEALYRTLVDRRSVGHGVGGRAGFGDERGVTDP